MNRLSWMFALLTVMATTAVHAADLKPTTTTGPVKMLLTVAATPLTTGKNTLTLKISDAQGKPLVTQELKAEISQSAKEMEAMGMGGMGMGSAKTTITPTTPGTYQIKTSLPFGGKWDLKVKVPTASASFSLAVK